MQVCVWGGIENRTKARMGLPEQGQKQPGCWLQRLLALVTHGWWQLLLISNRAFAYGDIEGQTSVGPLGKFISLLSSFISVLAYCQQRAPVWPTKWRGAWILLMPIDTKSEMKLRHRAESNYGKFWANSQSIKPIDSPIDQGYLSAECGAYQLNEKGGGSRFLAGYVWIFVLNADACMYSV